ncbi:hypothetical protein SESBI_06950 [Sesbania bispinosa]|nr:hypothetical protein SESBI_06950 [Sesbania bispinosa]
MSLQIISVDEAMMDRNSLADKLHQVAMHQVEVAEREDAIAENQLEMTERQVVLAKKQVEISGKQLTLMQQTRARNYSETKVWGLLEELGVLDEHNMTCYEHLCDNEKKRKVFWYAYS